MTPRIHSTPFRFTFRLLLLLRVLPTVTVIRLALLLMPFSRLRQMNVREPLDEQPYDGRLRQAAWQWAWAVRIAGRLIPGASCLTQALALQRLLRRRGINSAVRIGVTKGPDGSLAAHAWLERSGEVFIGGRNLERFTLLTDLDITTV